MPGLSGYGAGNWELIIPASTTNQLKNPSIETNANEWSACGAATLSRVSTHQKFGAYSLQVATTAAEADGANASLTLPTANASWTFSTYLFGAADVDYQMDLITDGSTIATGSFTGSALWGRHEITGVGSSATNKAACVAVRNDEATANTFRIDGMMVEAGSAATTYCDGEQPGCRWTAASHGSISQRSGQSRAGGAIVNLRDDYGIDVRQQPGTGMPPLRNIQTNLGLSDGGLFQRTLADVRTFTLEGAVAGSSIHVFHQFRQQLISAIQPNATAEQQPLLLRYIGVDHTVNQIKAHYDSGLELTDPESGIEFISVRFLSYDPFWEEVGNEAAILTAQSNITGCNMYVRSASDGVWQGLATGFDGGIFDLAEDEDSNLFVAGAFREINGASQFNGVVKYDTVAGTFSELDGGIEEATATTRVVDMVVDTNGDLFVAGNFDTAGSITACRIARYDGNAWNAVGTGACDDGGTDTVHTITQAPNGDIYMGGGFTVIGGASFTRVARFDKTASAWNTSGSFDDVVQDLQFGLDGKLYATGEFIVADNAAASGAAVWDPNDTSPSWTTLSVCGLRSPIPDIRIQEGEAIGIGLDGLVFFGGKFSVAGGVTACGGITQWNGTGFQSMGELHIQGGGQSQMTNLYIDESLNGDLYAIGNQRNLGGGGALITARSAGFSIWNGSFWNAGDITFNVAELKAITRIRNGDLFFGGQSLSAASAIGFTSVNNSGTNDVKPILQIEAPTTGSVGLYKFTNATTGDEISFNLGLQPGETVELDLENLTFISLSRGNLLGTILPTSNLASFRLLPGANQVGLFTAYIDPGGGDNASATLRWTKRHWSIDAGSSI